MEQISLADGRVLEVRTTGPADGLALIFHHGTPMSAAPLSAIDDAVTARGLRMVTWSRPGYGGSSRAPGRTVLDVVADADAVLDALGIERCVTAGWSGGGPHALACAAGLGRCAAALVIAGIAPADLPGLDFLAGMGEENVQEFSFARRGEAALRLFLDPASEAMRSADVAGLADGMGSLLPEVDQRQLQDGFGPEFAAAVLAGLSAGVDGWCDDDLAFIRAWGFALDQIRVPVTIWQGGADMMVPPAHAPALADHVPGARLHQLEVEGHVSLARAQIGPMLDELLALAGAPG